MTVKPGVHIPTGKLKFPGLKGLAARRAELLGGHSEAIGGKLAIDKARVEAEGANQLEVTRGENVINEKIADHVVKTLQASQAHQHHLESRTQVQKFAQPGTDIIVGDSSWTKKRPAVKTPATPVAPVKTPHQKGWETRRANAEKKAKEARRAARMAAATPATPAKPTQKGKK